MGGACQGEDGLDVEGSVGGTAVYAGGRAK